MIINNQTIYTITGSIEPQRDENGNIISITSSENQLNEVEQYVEQPSTYYYYTSSYLGQIFNFDFEELGVPSDEKSIEPATVPPGLLLISQSEYDYLLSSNYALQIQVEQLNSTTGSLIETINSLEETINSLLEIIGGGTASLNPTITTGQLLTGYINESYNSALNAQGGLPPYSWQIVAGNLPTGLNLSTDGIVSGTPTELFNDSITFKVVDLLQKSNQKIIGLVIKEHQPPPTGSVITITTPGRLPDANIGEYYEKQLVAEGGTLPYTWTRIAGFWPTGLSMNSNGLISGIATEKLTRTVEVEVKDNENPPNEKTKLFTIKSVFGI